MVKITPEIKQKMLEFITISKVNFEGKITDMVNIDLDKVKQFAMNEFKPRENVECKVVYSRDSPELFLWALGLICEIWTLNLLKQKAKGGHCYTHKEQNGKPCPKGTKFHKELFLEAKESFEEIARMVSMELKMK